MEFNSWLIILSAMLTMSISPGPGAINSIYAGINYTKGIILISIIGLQTGLLLQTTAIYLGINSIIFSSDLFFHTLKIIGAIYLILLGISQIYSNKKINLAATFKYNNSDILTIFTKSFIVGISNVKGLVFLTVIFTQFVVDAVELNTLQFIIIATTVVVVDTIVMICYATFAKSLTRLFFNSKNIKYLNFITGSILILIGISLFFFNK